MRMSVLNAFAVLLSGMSVTPAVAQITWDFSSVLATNQQLASSACLAGRCGTTPRTSGQHGSPTPDSSNFAVAFHRAARPAAAGLSLGYSADPVAKRRVLIDLIQRIRAKDPQEGGAVQAVFGKYDYDKLYDGIAGPYGLSGNDAGNALAAYLVLGWLIVNGQKDVPGGRAAASAVRTQISLALAQNSAASASHRALLGQELKLQFVMAHAGWLSAMRENRASQYAEGIARQFKQIYGFDLRRAALNATGLHTQG